MGDIQFKTEVRY